MTQSQPMWMFLTLVVLLIVWKLFGRRLLALFLLSDAGRGALQGLVEVSAGYALPPAAVITGQVGGRAQQANRNLRAAAQGHEIRVAEIPGKGLLGKPFGLPPVAAGEKTKREDRAAPEPVEILKFAQVSRPRPRVVHDTRSDTGCVSLRHVLDGCIHWQPVCGA